MSEARITALVHVGPAEEDEAIHCKATVRVGYDSKGEVRYLGDEAIYCEAVELAPGQRPGQKDGQRLWRDNAEATAAYQAFMARQQQNMRQSPFTDALASFGANLAYLGGFF